MPTWCAVAAALFGCDRLLNMYGPSECILASYHQIDHLDESQRSIPIGKAIGGRQLIVVDETGRLCPIGLTGEIYIRSPYLTNGYWGRAEDARSSYRIRCITIFLIWFTAPATWVVGCRMATLSSVGEKITKLRFAECESKLKRSSMRCAVMNW